MTIAAFLAYLATIPAANWMIGNVGMCVPNGPCLIPVGFGLMAPSGVLLIGLALVLRDVVHERLGTRWALSAIGAGGLISAFFAPPALVVASVAAFLLSELADLWVYTPLRRDRLMLAVGLSGAVGAAVDSAVFLFIAFGSLDYIAGQIVGKMLANLAAVPLLFAIRFAIKRCWLGHDLAAYDPPGYQPSFGIPMEQCTRCGHIECDSGRCP